MLFRSDAGQGEQRLAAYMQTLAARLERVRITAGDWRRVLKPSVVRATAGNPTIGVFLDPPYSVSGDLYAATNTADDHATISAQVREWCASAPDSMRIVLAGYDDEHDELIERGWTREAGKSGGGAGYSTNADNGKRERLWLSPACLTAEGVLDLAGLA